MGRLHETHAAWGANAWAARLHGAGGPHPQYQEFTGAPRSAPPDSQRLQGPGSHRAWQAAGGPLGVFVGPTTLGRRHSGAGRWQQRRTWGLWRGVARGVNNRPVAALGAGAPLELVRPEILGYKAFEPILIMGRNRVKNLDIRIRVRGGGQVSQIYGENGLGNGGRVGCRGHCSEGKGHGRSGFAVACARCLH